MQRYVVLVSAFLTMFFGSSLMSATGILHVALLGQYQESVTTTAWTGALFSAFFCLGGPLASLVINTVSCRACIICGGILNLIGFGLSSFVNNIYALYLTYGVVAGTGQSFGYTGAFVVVGFHFGKQRSLATGIVVAGFATGMVVFPFLTQIFVSMYELNGTFLLLSAIGFQICVFGAIAKPGKTEEALHSAAKRRREINKTPLYRRFCNEVKILFKMSFIIFCLSILLWCKALSIVTMYLANFYHQTGSSMEEAAFLTSLIGFGSIASRILTGIAAVDGGIDRKLIYSGSYGVIGILTITLGFYGTNYWGKAAFSSIFGLYTGGSWVLLSPITVELIGLENLATGFSVEMACAGIGLLIGPVIGGYILSGDDSFKFLFAYAGIMHFLAFFSGLLMTLFMHQDQMSKFTQDKPKLAATSIQDTTIEIEVPEKESFITSENN